MPKVAASRTVLVIHGPNLNLLGQREPEIYGKHTLGEINQRLKILAQTQRCELLFFQSNHEGELVDFIHKNGPKSHGIVINAAGLTHTSVVLRDALRGVKVPFVEVHLSNVYGREEFRRVSLLSDIARGVICGFGAQSYELGLEGLLRAID